MTVADAVKLEEALTAYDQGRSQEAQPILEELLRRHPDNFDISETLGLIHAEAGDFMRGAAAAGNGGACRAALCYRARESGDCLSEAEPAAEGRA